MIKLSHYDDKKEKHQSHEVFFSPEQLEKFREVLYSKELYNIDSPTIVGFGETKEQAEEEFKRLFDKYYEFICKIKEDLENIEIEDSNKSYIMSGD